MSVTASSPADRSRAWGADSRPEGLPPAISPDTLHAPLGKLPGGWELSVRAFRCWLVMYRRTWRASIWSSILGPLFYLGAMGYGLGSLVDAHGTASLGGVSYVVFIAPAVLAVHAMNTALSNSMFPVFGAMRTLPVPTAVQ